MPNYFGNFPQQQSFVQQQQFIQPQVNNTVLVVPVQGESGANIYPVAAGNTVFLIDFATKTFWIKATDVNGIPSRFEAYEFKNKVVPQAQVRQNGDFVSQSEFVELKAQLNNQFQKLAASLQGLLNNGGNSNAKLNEQSSAIPSDVQKICDRISEQQQRNIASTDGTKNA